MMEKGKWKGKLRRE